jgi:hypothetical protein
VIFQSVYVLGKFLEIFGLLGEEKLGDKGKLPNEDLHKFSSSSNIMKSNHRAGHAARMELKNTYKNFSQKT